jgi:hypothetical protein
MNEIFQDKVISYVVGILWAASGLSASMWSAEMNMFAFGTWKYMITKKKKNQDPNNQKMLN